MKTLFALVIVLMLSGISATAQKKVKVDSTGNYTSVSAPTLPVIEQKTGKFFIDSKGNKYPVFKSSNGKLYYFKVSEKTGNIYKVYIKTI